MRLFSILLLLFCFYSCSNPTPDFTTVHIEEVFSDSLQTIRDVQARVRANIWFSAGEGRVGVLQGGVPKIASVRYDETDYRLECISLYDSSLYILCHSR